MKNNGLNAKQERAIIALINETSIARAADVTGVNETTLHRWLGEDDFAGAYRKARREAFSQAIALTQRYAPLAVNTLAQVMMDQTAGHSAKVSAASAMLKFGREGIELDDLAARVEALEQAMQEQRDRRGPARW
jgi:hypothetical protein